MAATQTRSYCRLCPAYCGVLVTHDGDRVLKVIGDRDHPLSAGYTCPKGRALGELHHQPERLDRPMIRRNGRLEPVTWDELLDDLAAKVGAIVEEHGPAAVGFYFGTHATFDANLYWAGQTLMRRLGSQSKYTSGTVDAPSYPVVRRLMAGVGWLFHGVDFERTTMTLLLGTNPVVSHSAHMNAFPNPTARIRSLTARGEVWVVDARTTETARLATRHLPARPGTDYALLGYLIRELLRDGADTAYLERHARNVDALARAVEPFTLGEAARIADLPPDDLTALLAAIRRHGRMAIQTGTGTSMSPAANLTQWFEMALLAVTGSLERPGGVWFNPGFVQGLDKRPGTPDPQPEPGPPSRPELPRQGGEYPAITVIDEMESGNLQALFVLGGNLVAALPDAPRVSAAMRGTPVVAVTDVKHGDMTEHATHVLPAAGPLERADLPHFSDCLSPAIAAQYTPAVVPVGADRRPGWWPLAALGERLGAPILPEGLTLETTTDDDLLRRKVRSTSRATFDELREAGRALVDDDRSLGWVERNILPDGRWDLAPEPLVRQLDQVPEVSSLVLIPRRQWRHLNSYGTDLPQAEREPADVLIHPADAAAAGVEHGQPVEVESAFGGRLVGIANVSTSIRRGAVAIPHGWQSPNVSDLLSASEAVDELTGMPTYSGVPVSLTPVAEREGAAAGRDTA